MIQHKNVAYRLYYKCQKKHQAVFKILNEAKIKYFVMIQLEPKIARFIQGKVISFKDKSKKEISKRKSHAWKRYFLLKNTFKSGKLLKKEKNLEVLYPISDVGYHKRSKPEAEQNPDCNAEVYDRCKKKGPSLQSVLKGFCRIQGKQKSCQGKKLSFNEGGEG